MTEIRGAMAPVKFIGPVVARRLFAAGAAQVVLRNIDAVPPRSHRGRVPDRDDLDMLAWAKLRLIPGLRPDETATAIGRDRIALRLPGRVNFLPFLKGIMPVPALDASCGRLSGTCHPMDRLGGRA